jgi:heme iron utilization protein
MPQPDPYLAADDNARSMAARLLQSARHAALAVTDAASQTPNISRIGLSCLPDGLVFSLMSTLSAHTTSLLSHSACALMVGEPGPKGDPLTHPRLMIQAHATALDRTDSRVPELRAHWLHLQPKAKLYIDFADFRFVVMTPFAAVLNAGFGRAYRLQPADLRP